MLFTAVLYATLQLAPSETFVCVQFAATGHAIYAHDDRGSLP